MTSKIWVYIDQFRGVASPASWEAIGVAKSLSGGADVTALVFGEGVGNIVKQAFEYGADSVWVCDHATLADYRVEPYAGLLANWPRTKSRSWCWPQLPVACETYSRARLWTWAPGLWWMQPTSS
jgi:electron transfer flavoprotein alpha subunit